MADALAHRTVLIVQPSGIRNRARVLKVAKTLLESGRTVVFFTKLPVGSGFTDVRVDRVLDCPVLQFPDAHDFLAPARTRIPAVNWLLMVQYLHATMWHYARAIRPDVIHTFGAAAIGIGDDFRRRLRSEGCAASWVHDYLEYTRGHAFIDDRRQGGKEDTAWHETVVKYETEHAGREDHAFTVSPQLATALARDYGLAHEPTVLLNAPRLGDFEAGSQRTIRKKLRLGPDVPLIVYSGGVTPLRGVDALTCAIGRMPDVHLALITNSQTEYTESLVGAARTGGWAQRLHLVGYVEPDAVPTFLQDATAGVHPLSHYGNAEVALPNKLFDYLHARLPVVVSDVGAMAGFVTGHQLGEVFPAGNVDALVDALRRVIAAREPIVSRIARDDHLLAENAWESQEAALVEVYDRLSGAG
ncbi:glycosyltransferase [Dongia sp.]|uniref:glycosyltransferase n=1 Tax=Dongia sp. TaxID=1977262 RepID=UPI003752B07B